MVTIDISGRKKMRIKHLVLDYNGTIALDGKLLPGVRELIAALALRFEIHVLTADMHLSCGKELAGLPVKISVIAGSPEDAAKLAYVRTLGAGSCICIGNGMNDLLMLTACALGIVVVGHESAAARACLAADIIAQGIIEALQLLEHPQRILATLRN
ncbi:MAG: ATPase P [Proteobacteria bacterium]|nr:ATPase P [Pseudomonadota bacterium]